MAISEKTVESILVGAATIIGLLMIALGKKSKS